MAVKNYNSFVVCSAGNEGADMSSYCPAVLSYLDGCVTVSAGNRKGERWVSDDGVSNYGAGVDLMAPGDGIKSYITGHEDEYWSGTSMAAPHVAAAAALLKMVTGISNPAELEKLLLTATTSGGKNRIDDYFGYGFLDLDKAAVTPIYVQSGISISSPYTWVTDANGRRLYPVVVGTIPQPELTPTPQPAPKPTPVPELLAKHKPVNGSVYYIKSLLGKVYLNVSGGKKVSGTNVQVYAATATAAEKWKLVSAGGGYYYIKSTLGNFYLNVQGGKKASGTNVQIYTVNKASTAQKWQLIRVGTGNHHYIKSALGNFYLGVAGGNGTSGANVRIFTANQASAAQKWLLSKTS